MGPPGAGKGTQAEFIAAHFGDPEDLDRRHLPRERLRRHRARAARPRSTWTPATWSPTRSPTRWCATGWPSPTPSTGFLLDGFPRNVAAGRGARRHPRRDRVVAERRARPRGRPRRGRPAAVRPAHLQEVRPRLAPRVRPAVDRRTSATSAAASCTSATTTSRRPCGTGSRCTPSQTAPLIEFYGERGPAGRHRRARRGRGRHRAGDRRARPRSRTEQPSCAAAASGSSSSPPTRSRLMRAGRAGRRRALAAMREAVRAGRVDGRPGRHRPRGAARGRGDLVVPGLPRRTRRSSARRSTTGSCTASRRPRRSCADGDLISIDFGAIVDGWHGDSAITVPVGEVDAPRSRAMSEACETSMWDGLAAARAGGRLTDISHAVETVGAAVGPVRHRRRLRRARHRHRDAHGAAHPQLRPRRARARGSRRAWRWPSSR